MPVLPSQERALRSLPAGEYSDQLVRGLVLRVRGGEAPSRVWCVRTKDKRVTLSPAFPVLGLADARDKARALLLARDSRQAPLTFQDALELHCSDLRKRGARSATRREATMRLHMLPALKDLDVRDIKRRDLQSIVDKLADDYPAQAGQVAGMLATVFRWLLRRGYIESDPASGGLVRPQTRPRERVLSDSEIRALWRAELPEPYGRITKLCLLLAARRDEVAGLQRSEVGEDRITLPPSRTKQKREHVIPLTGTARELIAGAKSDHATLVMVGRDGGKFGGWGYAHLKAFGDCGWTLHDLRRTAATLMLRTGVRPDVVEHALGHAVGTTLMRTYGRHDWFAEKLDAFTRLESVVLDIAERSS